MQRMQSHDLIPAFRTTARRRRIRNAVETLYRAAGRRYGGTQDIPDSFPNTPRDGGWFNNYNPIAHGLVAYWLYGTAPEAAFAIGNWLVDELQEVDRQHWHRCPWLAPLALAAYERGNGALYSRLMYKGFQPSYARIAEEDYLYTFVGSTLRPLMRALGGAALAARFWQQLQEASVIGAPVGVPAPNVILEEATTQLGKWAAAEWTEGDRDRWGFVNDIGLYIPEWSEFPYHDGPDAVAMANNVTWFMAGYVVPEQLVSLEIAGVTRHDVTNRARDIATHAILYGYDPETGRNLKDIGWKPDDDNLGCYAPGFMPKPLRAMSAADRAALSNPGYFDISIALGLYRAPRRKRARAIVNWAKTCRCIRDGEVPLGLALMAIEFEEEIAEIASGEQE